MKKLLISFSARENGNCDEIAKYLAQEEDKVIYFRKMNVHNCSECDYECFSDYCKYHNDDIYNLYDEMNDYQKIVLIVPKVTSVILAKNIFRHNNGTLILSRSFYYRYY